MPITYLWARSHFTKNHECFRWPDNDPKCHEKQYIKWKDPHHYSGFRLDKCCYAHDNRM